MISRNQMKILVFSLPAIAPFRLDLTVWALRRRDRNSVDVWHDAQYIRVFILDNIPVRVQIEQKATEPEILVRAASHIPIPRLQAKLSNLLNDVLGLRINLKEFYELARQDEFLHPLALKFLGVKPPRFPTLFEALANAIACQQLSLEAALSILNHCAQKYGLQLNEHGRVHHAFPKPDEIMKCKCEDLMKLGFSRHKSETFILLAKEFSINEQSFLVMDNQCNEDIVKFLTSFKGIGRWSAEYVLLRGLGRTDILPGDDVAVQKNLQKICKLQKKPDYAKIKEIEKKWYPYAGIVYFHLLLQKLSESYMI